MNHSIPACKRLAITVLLSFIFSMSIHSQNVLSIVIPQLNINNQRLDNVLEIISNKGNFYFSYNSSIIKRDSLISTNQQGKTVKQLLDYLFNGSLEYKESGNYIILRRAPLSLSLIINQSVSEDKTYQVSGYVLDEKTGEKVVKASIYEKQRLVSSLTNTNGFFTLRLKNKSGKAALTVSKEFYQDTTVVIQPKLNQQVTITIMPIEFNGRMITVSPGDYLLPDSIAIDVEIDADVTRYIYLKSDSFKVEKTRLGDFMLSSSLKVQSQNLKKFFITRPFQLAVTPGLSTHGRLSAQVVNNFSFSIFGGYSGGVKGLELAGLFNIDKKDVKFVQVAGLFNIVGGSMTGVQVAGLHNSVLKNVDGLQLAGINNMTKGSLLGLQVAGIYNHVSSKVTGMQVAGISNFAKDRVTGMQLGGIANVSIKEANGAQVAGLINYAKAIKGVQIGGILNYARKLQGVQIGLINVADTSNGYSIGLINIVLKGYHKLSISTNEVAQANLAFKTGNSKLYSILLAGVNADTARKVFTYGYGIGKEFALGKRFSLNPEITSQYLYLGSWDHLNLLNKLHLNLNVKFGKLFSICAGPSFAVYYSDQQSAVSGYKFHVPPSGYRRYNWGTNVNAWVGWNVGINLF